MMALDRAETGPIEGGQRSANGSLDTRVKRTCTELQPDGSPSNVAQARPLSDFSAAPAYVLLGDPGAGKTTEFERECEELGAAATKVSARNFITLDPPPHEWRHETLFIDGLDEMRAGTTDARSPLDAIRNRLHQLGKPRFRLSCREADWLGNNDLQALAEVSPDSRITVLRLDPLSQSAARQLLIMRHPALDTESFVAEAWRQGIHSMLGNPLALTLLADAAGPRGDWPGSRLHTFETACQRMAGEHNLEHQVAGIRPPIESLIDASGYLCALLLLSGTEVCSAGPASDPSVCVALADLRDATGGPPREALRAALGTKLFKGADGTGIVPLHRQVAEFLAARSLAERISDGLPARRVVALMTGPSDGRVVTALRGLSAWLAAHSPEARSFLVDTDPIGVALYGDIRRFTTHDKERLLQALSLLTPYEPILDYEHPDSPFAAYRTDTAWAFRHLASADMVEPIRRILHHGCAEGVDERLKLLVLGALSEAEQSETQSLADLLPDLIALVRDASRPTALRRSALGAYRHILPEEARTQALLALLDELHEDANSDLDGALRGTLLSDLYPTSISPSQIFRYAVGHYQRGVGNRFQSFWIYELLKRSSDEQFVELLDALSEDASCLIPALRLSGFVDLPLELLARGLTTFGEALEPTHVDRWCRIVGPYEQRWDGSRQALGQIRDWLRTHPVAQRTAFLIRLRNRAAEHSPRSWGWRVSDPVLMGTFPAGFGLWCLEKAIELADAEPALSRALLTHSFVSTGDRSINDGLTLDVMRERIRGYPDLARELEGLCKERSERETPPPDPYLEDIEELRREQHEQERQRQQEWAEHLRAHKIELQENRFSPPDLHNLATEYLGLFSDSDPQTSPRRRLSKFLGGDEVAANAALAGLRGAVQRDDLPAVEETISLCLESQQSWLAYPVLASLHLLEEEDPASLDSLDDAVKRKALAIHSCVPLGHAHPRVGRLVWVDSSAWDDPPGDDQPRGWHDRWLDKDPALVLDVLYQCAIAGIRSGKDFPPGLSELAAITDHDEAVQNIRLKLLKAFPTRDSSARLPLLDRLLTKALQHPDRTALRHLVEDKLTLTSTVDGQQVRWLAVDAAISPTPGLPRLQSFVDRNEIRTRHLAEVLRHPDENVRGTPAHPGSIGSTLASSRDATTLKTLIEILGQLFAPTDWGGYVTLEMAMSEYLRSLIGRLGSLGGDDATQALEALIGDSRLASWHGHLEMATERQGVVRRDSSCRHPSIGEVQRTLDDRTPANAADLAALLTGRLADIAANIRGGNSNLWRQFWNEDRYGRLPKSGYLPKSKPEDSCRDALLENLQLRLPAEVDLVPEGQYAAAKRADLRAACGGFNVPIEIKKNSHRDLWSACRTQLISKYTTDPRTSGYGIYLVLWFGAEQITRHPNDTRPVTPKELEQQLDDDLTTNEARKISVVVMDVTKPGGT